MSELKCPFSSNRTTTSAGGGTNNKDWWPKQLNLDILTQQSQKGNPMMLISITQNLSSSWIYKP